MGCQRMRDCLVLIGDPLVLIRDSSVVIGDSSVLYGLVIPSGARDPQFYFLAPTFRQVLPGWIQTFNQRDALRSRACFDLLFSCDRAVDIAKGLVINETVDIVSFCEDVHSSAFMFQGSTQDVVGHSRVQVQRPAGHNVDVVASLTVQLQIPRFAGDDKPGGWEPICL